MDFSEKKETEEWNKDGQNNPQQFGNHSQPVRCGESRTCTVEKFQRLM